MKKKELLRNKTNGKEFNMRNKNGKKITALVLAALIAVTALACGCSKDNKKASQNSSVTDVQTEDESGGKKTNASDGKSQNTSVNEKVNEKVQNMTIDEKIWQMFFVRPEDIIDIGVAVQAGDATKQALESCPVGGIIYFSQNIKDAEQLKNMISATQSYSKTPLFIAVDEEGGRVARLGNAGLYEPKIEPMAQIGASGNTDKAAAVGEKLGENLKKFGFNVDFAPVADVITVANNEDIGDRSFGKDPKIVADMVAAEVKAMQDTGVSATLKHFPSNGSIEENTHKSAGVCTRTYEQMKECEFIPFKSGIAAGADFVMVAHMGVATVENGMPSTLSKTVIQEWLRGELGFEKIVISDALNMGAITSKYSAADAAKRAVKAGVDFVLMSPEPKAAFAAIKDAVTSGEISEERIDESVRRIISMKLSRGVMN